MPDQRWPAPASPTSAGWPRPARPTATSLELAPRGAARRRRPRGRSPDRRAGPARPLLGGPAGRVAAVSVLLRPRAGRSRRPPADHGHGRGRGRGVRRTWPASAPRLKWPNDLVVDGRTRTPQAGRHPGRVDRRGRRARRRWWSASASTSTGRPTAAERGPGRRSPPPSTISPATTSTARICWSPCSRASSTPAAGSLDGRPRRCRRSCEQARARSATLGRRVRVDLGPRSWRASRRCELTDDGDAGGRRRDPRRRAAHRRRPATSCHLRPSRR